LSQTEKLLLFLNKFIKEEDDSIGFTRENYLEKLVNSKKAGVYKPYIDYLLDAEKTEHLKRTCRLNL